MSFRIFFLRNWAWTFLSPLWHMANLTLSPKRRDVPREPLAYSTFTLGRNDMMDSFHDDKFHEMMNGEFTSFSRS